MDAAATGSSRSEGANEATRDGVAAHYFRDGRFEVKAAEHAPPAPGAALVEVECAGICGTDLHITHVPSTYVWETEVLGHEFCGRVVDGPATMVGRRYVVDPAIMCGVCAACTSGLPTNCDHFKAVGITQPGGFARYATVPVSNLVPVSDDLDARAAALAEPLACVLYGLSKLPGLRPGGNAVVLGGGPIGALFALVLERAMGRRVVVSEPSATRREHLAERLEGVLLEPPEPGDLPAAELVVDTTGFLFASAVEIARPGGVILCFGLEQRGGESAQVKFTQKELSAVSSFAAWGTFGTAVELLERGTISADDVVTASYPLKEIAAAFETARGGAGLKVLLEP